MKTEVQKIDLTKLENLNRESALELIGQETTCNRKIIGVSNAPGNRPDGVYVVVSSRFAKSDYVRVGN